MTMLKDWDLRNSDGKLLRLKRRDGETNDAYVARRLQLVAEAATLKTYLVDLDDYEVVDSSGVVVPTN